MPSTRAKLLIRALSCDSNIAISIIVKLIGGGAGEHLLLSWPKSPFAAATHHHSLRTLRDALQLPPQAIFSLGLVAFKWTELLMQRRSLERPTRITSKETAAEEQNDS